MVSSKYSQISANTAAAKLFLVIAAAITFGPVLSGGTLAEMSAASLGDTLANKPIPIWSGGALITQEGFGTTNPFFISYDRRGNTLGSVSFSIPGTSYLSVADFSRATDGTVAVCGSATDADGRTAPFIAWVSPDGKNTNVVRSAPYSPRKVTVGSDGAIWTVGFESMPNDRDKANPAGFIFRRWDRSGKVSGAYFPQSRLKDARSVFSLDFLRSSKDRIAWYSTREGRYIELSSTGTIVNDVSVDIPDPKVHIAGMALTDSGDVLIGRDYDRKWSILRLDFSASRWVEVESSTSGHAFIYGSDGDLIVARIGVKSGDFKFLELSR